MVLFPCFYSRLTFLSSHWRGHSSCRLFLCLVFSSHLWKCKRARSENSEKARNPCGKLQRPVNMPNEPGKPTHTAPNTEQQMKMAARFDMSDFFQFFHVTRSYQNLQICSFDALKSRLSNELNYNVNMNLLDGKFQSYFLKLWIF